MKSASLRDSTRPRSGYHRRRPTHSHEFDRPTTCGERTQLDIRPVRRSAAFGESLEPQLSRDRPNSAIGKAVNRPGIQSDGSSIKADDAAAYSWRSFPPPLWSCSSLSSAHGALPLSAARYKYKSSRRWPEVHSEWESIARAFDRWSARSRPAVAADVRKQISVDSLNLRA